MSRGNDRRFGGKRLALAAFAMAAAIALPLAGCAVGSGKAEDDVRTGKSNVVYEIFVRSFADSDGDGIGDFNGVTAKLDYIERLGADGIWLMPINPSPSYHGYDVTDYYGINPDYGTMDDFRKLVDEAHVRGIRVILDLVVNHTSVEHPWFAEAADKSGERRDWYIWASDREQGASPADSAASAQAWHAYGNDKYLGIFWSGMPDLNFDNPDVRAEMIRIGQHWLKLGVDGFRLDAAKHIFGDFKTTLSSPRVKEANKAWWQQFRQGMDEVNPDAFLVGEVWDSTAVIGPYLEHALNAAFNFDLAGKLISAADAERAQDIGFTLSRIYEFYARSANGSRGVADAVFLSNHDQNRVMTALRGNVDHARMAAAMLLTLPGNVFVYYGEELGMAGAKPDEHIREPFPWHREPGGEGETTWMAPRHRGDGSVSVEAAEADERSLLHHYRELIRWRSEEPALREGSIGSYDSGNPAVMAYVRTSGDRLRLVVHNLSGEAQTVRLAEATTGTQPTVFAKIAYRNADEMKLAGGQLSMPPYSTAVLKP